MNRRMIRVMSAVGAFGLLIAGCGSNGDDSAPSDAASDDGAGDGFEDGTTETTAGASELDESTADASAAEAQTNAGGGASAPASPVDAAPNDVVVVQPVDFGRDIIYTAEVTVAVDDVAGTSQRALIAMQTVGGLLFGQTTTTAESPTTVLTFRVLPERFTEALTALTGLGELVDQQVSTDDVTGTVIDLESRIRTAEVSVERLRGFLEEARDLTTIAQLEQQLLDRETALEQLRGQLRGVQDLVSLATITLSLVQAEQVVPDAEVEVLQTAVKGHDAECPVNPTEDRELEVPTGTEITICYLVSNDGATHLVDVKLVDDPIDVDIDDVVVIEGDLGEPLAPDERIVLSYETAVTEDVTTDVEVTAVPAGSDGTALGSAIGSSSHVELRVDDEEHLPGFVDALKASGRGLRTTGSVLLVFLGAVLPLVPFLLLGGGIWASVTRRRRSSATPTPAAGAAPSPTA